MILEEEQFDEMSIRIISFAEDRLPFKIAIKCPDKGRHDHAHIIKLGTKADEIGAFIITGNTPKAVKDLVGYTEGGHEGLKNLKLDELQALVSWASRQNSLYPGTNWQALHYEYAVNRNS
jgi:hypothetical protein